MRQFYVELSSPESELPDVQLWSREGALRELLWQYSFPEYWNKTEREAEFARLQAAAEALCAEMPKDFMFFLLEDLRALEKERKANWVPKKPQREPQNFRADFGNVCAMERVGSFSRSGAVDGLW